MSSTLININFVWEWLYSNFSPVEEVGSSLGKRKRATKEEDRKGILQDDLLNELLSLPEVNKKGNPRASIIAKLFIRGCLSSSSLLYANISKRKRKRTPVLNRDNSQYLFDEQQKTYKLRRLSQKERQQRLKNVPQFPEELNEKLLKELRAENFRRTPSSTELDEDETHPSSGSITTTTGGNTTVPGTNTTVTLETTSTTPGSNTTTTGTDTTTLITTTNAAVEMPSLVTIPPVAPVTCTSTLTSDETLEIKPLKRQKIETNSVLDQLKVIEERQKNLEDALKQIDKDVLKYTSTLEFDIHNIAPVQQLKQPKTVKNKRARSKK